MPRAFPLLFLLATACSGTIGGLPDDAPAVNPAPPAVPEPVDHPACGEAQPDVAGCATESFPIDVKSVAPLLMVVADRSGSMGEPFCPQDGCGLTAWEMGDAPATKWDRMRDALIDVTVEFADRLWFGLVLFPTGAGVDVAIGPDNAPAVEAALRASAPGGDTPADAALATARTALPGSGERYVLLATDGIPNCPDCTLAQTEALSAAGVQTWVLGLQWNADPAFLEMLAEAGGTAPAAYADSTGDLVEALDEVAGESSFDPCTFQLCSTVPDVDRALVTVSGRVVARDEEHRDGWDYDALDDTVTFYGPACERLAGATDPEVRVTYDCPTIE